MEPRIQYAKTKDGVSIAYYTLGEGMPLVQMPSFPWSHVQLEWRWPEFRSWWERLAQKRMLVRYDGRGSGLSDRDVTDYSLEAHMLDLEAVIARLRLERAALCGSLNSGPVAVAFAARHPDQVSHLVLWHTWARASDYYGSPQTQAFSALRDRDWDLYTETVAHASFGWSEGEFAHRFAAFMKECVTQVEAQAAYSALREFDVTTLLAKVKCPTLVLHLRQVPFPQVGVARGLATRIPDARLALLEGQSVALLGDMEAAASAIDEFLGEGEEAASVLAREVVHTILFTDVEESTALTQRLGDARARDILRTYERIVREALKAHGGSEVKTMGDGFMASFSSATKALECAIAIQRAVERQAEPVEAPLRVRVGMNAGEPIAEEEDLFGTAVIVAARIAARAEGGEILASNVVRELVAGKGFLFSDRGDTELRGFEDAVRLYEVRWREPAGAV